LAHEWKVIGRVPRVRLLSGEQNREFVLTHDQERLYLAAAPEDLRDIATILLDAGVRIGELLRLEWPQVHLKPATGAKYGYLTVLSRNSKTRSRGMFLSAPGQVKF
ncbi:MAG: hypothetical protein WKF37_24680, partial [Bryobacteraceae bacterium]